MRAIAQLIFIILLAAVTGCSKKATEADTASAVSGESGKPGSYLAYEHRLEVVLTPEAIPARMDAVRSACAQATYGNCSLLNFEQSSGRYAHGTLTLRVAPEAVEPLSTLAAEHGRVGSQQTRAEDLAEAVSDNNKQREMMELQRATLLEFRARRDLPVSDVITVARELATIESELQNLMRSAAEQQRRIESNLLSIDYRASFEQSRLSRLGEAFDGVFDEAVDGSAEAIGMLAFGLPFLLLAFPLALLWRWAWRRLTGGRKAG
jgi:hypothetical protein